MEPNFRFEVEDVFRFRDGRTVFVGTLDPDTKTIVGRGPFEVWVDDQKVGIVIIEGQMIHSGPASDQRRRRNRSLSTAEPFRLTRDDLAGKRLVLQTNAALSARDLAMHRHLLGIESPPPDYVPDSMTLGPALPEGWDGDSWEKVGGRGYFLRAWNKDLGRIALGQADTYEEARRRLMGEISTGTRRVAISFLEAQPA